MNEERLRVVTQSATSQVKGRKSKVEGRMENSYKVIKFSSYQVN